MFRVCIFVCQGSEWMLVVGDTCSFQVSRYPILWLEVSVVSGTIPIPQNDVIVCQRTRDRVIFTVNGQQRERTKAQVPIFWAWLRVISGLRKIVG